MRKVTSGLFHSVDGVVSDPFLWQFDSFDERPGLRADPHDGERLTPCVVGPGQT